MSKDFSPTHIIITAIADRGRNGIRFAKNVAKPLKVGDFTTKQLEKFENDHRLTHKYVVDEELAAADQKEADEKAAKVAKIAANKTELDAAAVLKANNQSLLIAALYEYPEADLTKAGNPNLSKLSKSLGFDVNREQLEAAQAHMAKENAK